VPAAAAPAGPRGQLHVSARCMATGQHVRAALSCPCSGKPRAGCPSDTVFPVANTLLLTAAALACGDMLQTSMWSQHDSVSSALGAHSVCIARMSGPTANMNHQCPRVRMMMHAVHDSTELQVSTPSRSWTGRTRWARRRSRGRRRSRRAASCPVCRPGSRSGASCPAAAITPSR